MATSMSSRLSTLASRLRAWYHREHPDPPVDLDDPMGGALRDADLLMAYAAQSRRSVKKELAEELAKQTAGIQVLRQARQAIPATDAAAFWSAYDAYALAMEPLSAHSIRASLRMNRMRFPRSLLTPTALNALLAVAVFYGFLSLQSFWVAGKEMVDRADALEREKAELAVKLANNRADIDDKDRRAWSRRRDHCNAAGDCIGPNQSTGATPRRSVDASVLATLDAEIRLLDDSLAERYRLQRQLVEQQDALALRSRPLEELMATWYERATDVCNTRLWLGWELRPLAFICSLRTTQAAGTVATDAPQSPAASRLAQVRARIALLQAEADARRDARIDEAQRAEQVQEQAGRTGQSSQRSQATADGSRRVRAIGFPMRSDADMLRSERLEELQMERAGLEADQFGRKTTEVRMIVSNLGTYLIALVMGLLGALTYILRTLSQQLREHTYVPVSISEGVVRICLGAIAGVFGSLLVPTAGKELAALPPIFIPFVFGYGIEILFSMLDRVVRSFTEPDRTGTNGSARA